MAALRRQEKQGPKKEGKLEEGIVDLVFHSYSDGSEPDASIACLMSISRLSDSARSLCN